ncbi:MAG TPA: alpha/beta hydrolase [Candidatus Hydrogenedens sp.]|nr:alpha/beta hydrolase [Candidatus Hydrogenedens sp.]
MENNEYKFVKLSNGDTCYQTVGKESNPVVVLLHGSSSPMCSWDKNIYELSNNGFCVVRYDLYGRGYSARPHTHYNSDLFVNQLNELLDKLALPLPIHLVGVSLGGAIVADFTVRYPEKVNKIVLIAPAGLLNRTLSMRVMGIPLLGKMIYKLYVEKNLIDNILKTWEVSDEDRDRLRQIHEEQIKIPGYREAILSTIKYGPLYDLENVYIKLGKQKREGCLIWGKKDNVVPFSLIEKLMTLVPWLKLYTIEDGTHAVNYQKADIVNTILCSFLVNK